MSLDANAREYEVPRAPRRRTANGTAVVIATARMPAGRVSMINQAQD